MAHGRRHPRERRRADGGAGGTDTQTRTKTVPVKMAPPETVVVNKPEPKVDAIKLVKGRAVFADDMELPGMLYGGLLTSPHAHARIKNIDASKARALPGVHAVLTHMEVPRVVYAAGGQSYPNPPPYDQVSLDNKVRHVGDRVAVVAAETREILQQALELIEVEYEVLPAVFDPVEAMQPGAPKVHDEPDAVKIHDADRNLVHHLHVNLGDVEAALAKAAHVYESEYTVQQVQQTSIEPHIVLSWWDEDDRLVIRTSTQVPFHVRRMVAPLLGLPLRKIRVVKPRIGGGFGGKQEMLIEDLCAHLTLATGRPVRFEYTREQEFTSSRSRHPQILRFRSGVDEHGKLVGMDLHVVADTGAYGTHGLTVQMVTGFRGLSTYWLPNARFDCLVVYTNKPTPGAFRGYGAPQALFGLEQHMEEFALAAWRGPGRVQARQLGQGRPEPAPRRGDGRGPRGLCADRALQWARGVPCRRQPGDRLGTPQRRAAGRAIRSARTSSAASGWPCACTAPGSPASTWARPSIKLNDDGSFNLLIGATDLGTGSDTVLAQIAAETLGVPLDKMLVYSSDTDFTPFDTGAYASSTTYISGGAVLKAAEEVREQILAHAAKHFLTGISPDRLWLEGSSVVAPDGRSVDLETLALHSLHQAEQHQIMATASHMSYLSPPPFATQFAEVEVDTQTGEVTCQKLVMAVDCGIAINPVTASGQVEGGMLQALGYALCEEMVYDGEGRMLNTRFGDYRIFTADETPELQAILVQTYEPSGPYGAKAVAEIPMDGVAPAIANAIYDATGVRLRSIPFTPERVWRALQGSV